MTAFNGYPISVFLAVLLHGAVLGALLLFQQAESEVLDVVRPPAVKALLVAENPQARNERVQQQNLQQQRERAQQEQARQQREQQQREQQERDRQEQLRQEQQQQEQARQAQLRQERERQEREEQARTEQLREEQRRQEEARRQQQLEQQRQQEAERQRQAAQAQADAAAAELAETDAEITMAYTAVIHDLVQRNWSRPPSARNDMTAVLRIRLVPTGDVVDVEIVRSSGDAAFDRAAENAVRAVGRFTELQGMPPRMFERSFRSLLLTFRPEDLLN